MLFSADIKAVGAFSVFIKEGGKMTFSSHKRHGNKPDLNNVFVFEVALQRAFAAHQVVITHGFFAASHFGFYFNERFLRQSR